MHPRARGAKRIASQQPPRVIDPHPLRRNTTFYGCGRFVVFCKASLYASVVSSRQKPGVPVSPVICRDLSCCAFCRKPLHCAIVNQTGNIPAVQSSEPSTHCTWISDSYGFISRSLNNGPATKRFTMEENELTSFWVFLFAVINLFPLACRAQQAPSDIPDDPKPSLSIGKLAGPSYAPPTQSERFKAYLRQTYGIRSFVEAGVRGGIDQASDRPSEWPEGALGYADRFGSAMGKIAIRGTTEYVIADIFREDLRRLPCSSPCSKSAFKRALEDTFTARKGEDGHRSLSVARLVGPFSGSSVAVNTWYPSTSGRSETVRDVAGTFGYVFARNLIRELFDHP